MQIWLLHIRLFIEQICLRNLLFWRAHPRKRGAAVALSLAMTLLLTLLLGACTSSPAFNVIGYELEKRLGLLPPAPMPEEFVETGRLTGRVLNDDGAPIAGATALVATRIGTPFTGTTDSDGHYLIEGVPRGQYVPAFTALGYEDAALQDWLGIPRLITVGTGGPAAVPDITLAAYQSPPLPQPLPQSVEFQAIAEYRARADFPPDSQAQAWAFSFVHNGLVNDTLRLYLPADSNPNTRLPLMFMIYPTDTDAWETVSVGYAAQGFAFVAVSPLGEHGLDIDAHAQDARVAFALALEGHLHDQIDPERVIALGGSFSSAILDRFLRDESARVNAWVNVGGISNAFTGAAEFYRGELEMPPEFELAIPALGPANLYPLPFLQFSPVYNVGYLPPTFIVHTEADRIATIDQALQLEAALHAANIPVETFYYVDDSHYLLIGADITDASVEVFERILAYMRDQLEQ